jgi:hypothetical protein
MTIQEMKISGKILPDRTIGSQKKERAFKSLDTYNLIREIQGDNTGFSFAVNFSRLI